MYGLYRYGSETYASSGPSLIRKIVFIPQGGGLGGGQSALKVLQNVVPVGGSLGGGASAIHLLVNLVPSGGGIGGGESSQIARAFLVASGGGLGGGTSIVPMSKIFVADIQSNRFFEIIISAKD